MRLMKLKMENEVKQIKQKYRKGTRIQLDYMADPFAVPSGTCGTIRTVDDIGQIHVDWDNGSGLALNVDLDEFHIIEEVKIPADTYNELEGLENAIEEMEQKMNNAKNESEYYEFRGKLTDLMAKRIILLEDLQ